jgi:hypothetical protein
MNKVWDFRRERLLQDLDDEGCQGDLRSAGGAGAGGFLMPFETPGDLFEDAQFRVACRLRLQVARPGALHVAKLSPHCKHRAKSDGTMCGEVLDNAGLHPLTCKCGGLITGRHDGARDWLAGLVGKSLGREAAAACEQYVPRWDRTKADGSVERARLDVVYLHGGRRVFVDLAFVTARSRNGAAMRSQAARDGAAAEREEDDKRRRYPGPDLRPFVVESLGRMGEDASALLRDLAPTDPVERSAFMARARRELYVLLQKANAELLLRAEQ